MKFSPISSRSPLASLAVALLGLLLGACHSVGQPETWTPPDVLTPEVPLVLVPGVTGVALRDAETGTLAWGDGKRLLVPRDHGWAFALPLVENAKSSLEPDYVIREIRLGPIRKPVYGPVLDGLEAAGYRIGDLEDPQPGTTLFPFAYDWRQSNDASAARLARQLENLRRARGLDELEVDLICQSNGAYVCRWLAKYGEDDLASLPGDADPDAASSRVRVRRILFAGTANGGAMRMFRELTRGRRYLPLGRAIRPETLFTLPSFFQDLPTTGRDRFVDDAGHELELSLDRVDDWIRQGWSIFSDAARARIGDSPRGHAIFGDPELWERHLQEELDRSRAFHAALRRDTARFEAERYCTVQSRTRPTPIGAASFGGELAFTGDKALRRVPEVEARITADGDQHATVESQRAFSPRELEILEPTTWVDGDHFELILDPASLDAMLVCFRD